MDKKKVNELRLYTEEKNDKEIKKSKLSRLSQKMLKILDCCKE